MAPYAIRLDLLTPVVMSAVLAWIRVKSPGYLVVKHSADEDVPRDHWHALIWSDKKEQALRVDFKKANPEFCGNKMYSLTEIKKKNEDDPVEAYERYMCHSDVDGGVVDVVACEGLKYTKQWFVEQNAAFYERQREFKKKAAKKERTQNMVNDLLKIVQEAGITSRDEISLKMVNLYVAERRPMNVFYMRQVVNTVWAVVAGKDAIKEMAMEIAGKF